MTKQFSKGSIDTNYSVDNSLQHFLASLPVVEAPVKKELPKIPWIKACPFCGEAPTIDEGVCYQIAIERDDEHIFGCQNDDCPVQPCIDGDDLDELIKKWNTRP